MSDEATPTREERVTDLLRHFRELGFQVREDSGEEINIWDLPEKAKEIRLEIEAAGWRVYIEKRAYIYEAFAYRMFYGSRQTTPNYVKDVLRAKPGSDAQTDILQEILADISSVSDDPATFFTSVPVREVGMDLYWTLKAHQADGKLLDLLPDGKAKLGLKFRDGHEEEVVVPLHETSTKDELDPTKSLRKTSGQVAYDAYCQARGWKSVKGDPLPQFHQIDPMIAEAWQLAAKAVLQAGK